MEGIKSHLVPRLVFLSKVKNLSMGTLRVRKNYLHKKNSRSLVIQESMGINNLI